MWRSIVVVLVLGCASAPRIDPIEKEGRDFFDALVRYAAKHAKAYACAQMPTIAKAIGICEAGE